MTEQQGPPLTIYLLHFDRNVGQARHYLGITRADRLDERLAEHCGEHAASLTSRAAQQQIPFTLVRTWPAETYADERRMKRAGHLRERCPICRGDLDIDGKWKRYVQRTTTAPGGTWAGLAFDRPSESSDET